MVSAKRSVPVSDSHLVLALKSVLELAGLSATASEWA